MNTSKESAPLRVLVTGASRGIGAAIVRHFAERGHSVAAIARNGDALQRLQDDASTHNGRVLPIAADLADPDATVSALAQAITELGHLDLVVNNAGLIDPIARIAEIDFEAWNQAIALNLSGAFQIMQLAIRHMQPRGQGMIINLSSGAANRPLEGWAAYCSSKAGLQMLTRCADLEYRAAGLKILGLSPGTVATPMQTRIRKSGVNPVSQLPADAHIPAEWVAQTVEHLYHHATTADLGDDFSLKTAEGRQRVGLPGITD